MSAYQMDHIEKTIEVNVPIRTAYNQWTQFEEFPQFMEGIKEVTQLDDKRLHWRAEIAGKDIEWDSEITQQVPDDRIAWTSTTGKDNAGQVRFMPAGSNRTRVTLWMAYDPEGVAENVADAIGVVGSKIEGDLKRFKHFIEKHGTETGAWRGSTSEFK
jgi:uncharacterized membrane protein